MLMGILAAKRKRLQSMSALMSRHAEGARSHLALLSSYISTLRTTTSKTERSLDLRIGTDVFPIRMRESDVFVLEEILLERQYELQTRLRSAPTIIDAGANIGISALWFLAQYPGATLHALEPEPENVRLLRANLGALSQVSVEAAAVGATTSTVMLRRASHGALHSLKSDAPAEGSISVRCVTLNDYLESKRIDRVDLLKLDVEGSEYDALLGLGDRLGLVHTIVGELHETMVSEAAFYQYLTNRGFRVVRREYYGSGREDGVHAFEVTR
jgi:FkbM family methyltransferase